MITLSAGDGVGSCGAGGNGDTGRRGDGELGSRGRLDEEGAVIGCARRGGWFR